MSEYRKAFEEKAAALESAMLAIAVDLDRALPGFDQVGIKRFISQFRILLGKVDAKKVKRPVYLAYGSPNLPQFLIDQMDAALNYANQGSAQFVQNSLTSLVEMQIRLERAVGLSAQEIDEAQRAAIADTSSLIDQLEAEASKGAQANSKFDQLNKKIEISLGIIEQRVSDTTKDFDHVKNIRKSVDELATDDGRPTGAIEKQLRIARDKSKIVAEIQTSTEIMSAKILQDSTKSAVLCKSTEDVNLRVMEIEKKANNVLTLATQAGLAASYIQERAKLLKQQTNFTRIFYALIFGIAVGAAFYIIPALENVVKSSGQGTNAIENSIVALIRIGIFAPLIWAVMFTSQRIQRLEMLQLDYAEKAAASLAYSGYREEMDADPDLLRRLKDGLLLRFSEHPERLLQKRSPTSKVSVSDDGFVATTESGVRESD